MTFENAGFWKVGEYFFVVIKALEPWNALRYMIEIQITIGRKLVKDHLHPCCP
jgi:hypothetical protein